MNTVSIYFLSFSEPWYPKHISHLDQCNHLIAKFEPDLDMAHPGWADKAYRKRRTEIANIAFNYRQSVKYENTIVKLHLKMCYF